MGKGRADRSGQDSGTTLESGESKELLAPPPDVLKNSKFVQALYSGVVYEL